MNANISMPGSIAALPKTPGGIPIPWFVADATGDRPRDFRIIETRKIPLAIEHRFCWICGRPMQRWKTFVFGPMSAIQRIAMEPPSHPACAAYAARVCPFMTNPKYERRDDLPQGAAKAPLTANHNPGITCLWTTHFYRYELAVLAGGAARYEFHPAQPSSVAWYRQGRLAAPGEVKLGLDEGYHILRTHPQRTFTDVELEKMFAAVPEAIYE